MNDDDMDDDDMDPTPEEWAAVEVDDPAFLAFLDGLFGAPAPTLDLCPIPPQSPTVIARRMREEFGV